MRAKDNVIQFVKRQFGREGVLCGLRDFEIARHATNRSTGVRIAIPDVQPGAVEPLGLEGLKESFLVDDLGSCDVDEDCVFGQQCKFLSADLSLCFGGLRQRDDEELSERQ